MQPGINPNNTVWKTEAEWRGIYEAQEHGTRRADRAFTFPTAYTHGTRPEVSWVQGLLPNLYIGEQCAMFAHYDTNLQAQHQYALIIDLSQNTFQTHANPEPAKLVPLTPSAHHICLDIEDSGVNFDALMFKIKDGNPDIFTRITQTLNAGQKVLINCQAGQSRSVTVAILYLMETYRMSAVQAYHHIRSYRAVAQPNPGYFSALLVYESTLANTQPIPQGIADAWCMEYALAQATSAFTVLQGNVIVTIGGNSGLMEQDFISCASFLKANNIPFITADCHKHRGKIILAVADYKTYQQRLSFWQEAKRTPVAQAQRNQKPGHLAISQAAAWLTSSAIVIPSALGLTGTFTPMYAMMVTGSIFAISTAVCIGIDNKNLKAGIAIFVLETGVTAGLSYVSFTYIAPALADTGLGLPAADGIMCASIVGLLLLANFGTQVCMNSRTPDIGVV